MTIEDAFRKIRLLRKLVPENGASEAEAETASRLVHTLMERYSVGREDLRPIASPPNGLTWLYWEQLLAEFGMRLHRFGGRASASLGSGERIIVRLAAGQWQIEQRSPTGWKLKIRDFGLEALRAYLAEHAPRSYSLAG